MNFLDAIRERKLAEVRERKQATPEALLRERAQAVGSPRDFAGSLLCGSGIIAEIKKASPSRGILPVKFSVEELAEKYERGGASCLSVLTDGLGFQGSLADLTAARAKVAVPVIRKDFILDPYQVWEARAAGADAVLLIVAFLEEGRLWDLHQHVRELGMAPLVEVHNQEEAEAALRIGAKVVGVNHRDLKTFQVNLALGPFLAPLLAEVPVRVAESGVSGLEDIQRLRMGGFNAFLIGERLATSEDPERELREWIETSQASSPFNIKICGLTNELDAREAARLGADALGFIFAPSPRRLDPQKVSPWIKTLPPVPEKVGVFQDAPLDEILKTLAACGLNAVQLHGSESPEFCREVTHRTSLPVIKAVMIKAPGDEAKLPDYQGSVRYLIVEWKRNGPPSLPRINGNVWLAGGLNPSNVAQSIQTARPQGLDVCSGVELAPGKKDHALMASFIQKAKKAAAMLEAEE